MESKDAYESYDEDVVKDYVDNVLPTITDDIAHLDIEKLKNDVWEDFTQQDKQEPIESSEIENVVTDILVSLYDVDGLDFYTRVDESTEDYQGSTSERATVNKTPPTDWMEEGLSEYDRRYKNDDEDLSIYHVEELKSDNSGPWATTATTVYAIYVLNRSGFPLSTGDVDDWASLVPGFKSSYLVDRKIEKIEEIADGEWMIRLRKTVWQN